MIIRWSTLCGSRKYPYPPTEDHWKLRGGGGFKGSNFRGVGGFMGNYFPKGDRPCTKHGKQRTINLKHKNIPTYVVWKQKSVLLAIDMRLNSSTIDELGEKAVEKAKVHVQMSWPQNPSCKTTRPPADPPPLRMTETRETPDQHCFAFNLA